MATKQIDQPAGREPERERGQSPRGWWLSGLGVLFLGVGLGIQAWASGRPDWVEEHYSQGIFPVIAAALASVSSRCPFSVGEGLALVILLRLIFGVIRTVPKIFGWSAGSFRQRLLNLGQALLRLLGLAGSLYLVYVLTWGLNHQRKPFAEVAGYEVSTPTSHELAAAAASLIGVLEELRSELEEDAEGVSLQKLSTEQLSFLANEAYAKLTDLHPSLHRVPGVVRRAVVSPLMTASWISGVYSPFTVEAHINVEIPDSQMGFVICHELAHSLGFAREDEANFLAYLATTRSSDSSVRYSGALAAWNYLINALAIADSKRAKAFSERLVEPIRRDLLAQRKFWERKRTVITALSKGVNDTYLKSQGHTQGIASYGLVAELLVAKWRADFPNFKTEPYASALASARKRTVRIAFVGGCMTSGGEDLGRFTYPMRVAERLAEKKISTEIRNLGVCEHLGLHAKQSLEQALEWHADIVVLEPSADAIKAAIGPDTSLEEIDRMIFDARRAGVRVLFLAPVRPDLANGTEQAIRIERTFRELASRRGLPTVNDFAEGVGGLSSMLRSDLKHPNSSGIERLAEQVYPRLQELVYSVRRQWAEELVTESKRSTD